MFKSIPTRIVIVMLATLAIAACGNASAEDETTVSSSTVAATTTTSATTTIPEVTTTTAITTTTVEETTTTGVEEISEQITSDLDFGSCSFSSQPTPADHGARIRIDSIGLDDTLLFGLTDQADAPTWCVDSSNFGQPGYTIIGGHRTTLGGAFRNLPNVSIDDIIVIEFEGIRYEYQVTETPVSYTVADAAKVLQGGSTRNILKLFACGPEQGQDTHRWIVTAKLISQTIL